MTSPAPDPVSTVPPATVPEVPTTMQAAVLHGPGDLRLETRPVPTPGPGEVLVAVAAVGVCGSDTHYLEHGRIGSYVVEAPLVLGHETSGRVAAVGAGVATERIGERVSLEPGIPCGGCERCRAGRYNLCASMRFHATPPIDGTLAEYVTHPAELAHPVPETVSDISAAMLEPLSVGLWACRRVAVGLGDRVFVTGAGPVGLLAAQVARVAGAQITVCDIAPERRAVAASLDLPVLDPATQPLPEVDVLLECSGHPGASIDGLRALAPAGRAVLIGMGADELAVPMSLVQERELVVTGTFRYAGTWPVAIDLAARGLVALDSLPVTPFALADTAEALLAGRRDPSLVKAVIHPGADPTEVAR